MICEFLKKCHSLEEIHLSNNEIDNDGASELIKVLKGKDNFSNIDIDNNKVSGETLTNLFNVLLLFFRFREVQYSDILKAFYLKIDMELDLDIISSHVNFELKRS